MSGLLALAKPRRIKASHRRRGKVAWGPIVQRYYDPGIGRFLSVDPVTANSATGSNFNRYWYANNSPYKFTDPDGRCPPDSPCWWDIGGQAGKWFADLGPLSMDAAYGSYAAGRDALPDHYEKAGIWILTIQSAALPELGPGVDAVIGGKVAEAVEGQAAKVLFRRGASDSAKTLAKQSQDALNKIGIHGVSVSTSSETRKAGQVVRSALQSDLEKAGVKVTKTGADPNHHTAELPNPVTKEFEKVWNDLFN